ncbi:hypothetical protein GQR60_13945 [Labilibaculum sp. A4]|uniref:Uncharacterized protein n=1 Tax=Labilibaculum euxinus TaxID=2686357 RepID=A0A7M4D7V1_9BACT|nr:hypothetical protein [Labilibaculum euxinus]MBN2597364.1 hypothetical protein [Marinifilaceae bacterium]MDQ1770023.1 hypothetical protein [Labilibaculum euxinus]MUP38730.1 hypothetical protein [Labilibaculum euxinus]MVB07935.1 hypothetical protein [Labilibaculum euxinus]MWN77445.1 hypothetical protein [Labilibaculum euxinus]
MSALLVIVFLALLTSIMVLHIHNELNLSKRINRAGYFVQELMDQHGIKHLDLEKKFETSTLTTQLRVLEYYLHSLNSSYKDFGTKKTIFQRIITIEQTLANYGYQSEFSVI